MSNDKIQTSISARGHLWNVLRDPEWSGGYTFERDVRIGRFEIDFYCPKLRYGVEVVRELEPDYAAAQHKQLFMARGVHITRLRELDLKCDIGRWLRHVQNMVTLFAEDLERADEDPLIDENGLPMIYRGFDRYMDDVWVRFGEEDNLRAVLGQCLRKAADYRFVPSVTIDGWELDFLCLEASLAVIVRHRHDDESYEEQATEAFAEQSIHVVFVEREEATEQPFQVARTLGALAKLRVSERADAVESRAT